MARFFIDRPIFAWVVAIFIMLAGLLAIPMLPIAQYPNVAPPQISLPAVVVVTTVVVPLSEPVVVEVLPTSPSLIRELLQQGCVKETVK